MNKTLLYFSCLVFTMSNVLHSMNTNQPERPSFIMCENGSYNSSPGLYDYMLDKSFHLIQAVSQNDLSKVQQFIRARTNVNVQNNRGWTPLILAAWNGNEKITKELIKAGAKLDTQEYSYKKTALMLSADRGNLEVVKELIRAGANVNIKDRCNKTALMYAAAQDNKEITKELIKAGANVNIEDYNGKSALIYATKISNNREVIKELIKAGANPNVRADLGDFALLSVASGKDKESVKELIKAGANPDTQNLQGITALMGAAYKGYKNIAKELIKAGANLNIKGDTWTNSAHTTALKNERMEIADLINTFSTLDEDFTQIDLSALNDELIEIFMHRLLYYNKQATLVKFITFIEQNLISIENLPEASQKAIEFIKKWHKNALNPKVARTILLNQEDDFKDTLEVQVYKYAQENAIKPLGLLIRSWARTTHDLSRPSQLMVQGYEDISSHIGSFSTIQLNDKNKQQLPPAAPVALPINDANHSAEVIAIGQAIKKENISLTSSLVDKKSSNFNNEESTYLRGTLNNRTGKSLVVREWSKQINSSIYLKPGILGATIALVGKKCMNYYKNNSQSNTGFFASLGKKCSTMGYYGGLATAIASSAACVGGYALWKYSSNRVDKAESVYNSINTILARKER